jgi:hypothetical protein
MNIFLYGVSATKTPVKRVGLFLVYTSVVYTRLTRLFIPIVTMTEQRKIKRKE